MSLIAAKDLQKYLQTEIVTLYLVMEKEIRDGARDKFIRLRLGDKTGSVVANVWNNAEHFSPLFEVGDVIKIKGQVKDYKGQLQVSITKLRKAEPEEYSLKDFLAATEKDVEQLGDKLFQFINAVEDPYIKELLSDIFNDVDFFKLFAQAPAAKTWHHNFIGGLLEHTVAVTEICEYAAQMYPVNKDLLIAGALLHDIGKVYEYNIKPVVEFTNYGRLVGHINIADHFVTKKSESINAFPAELLMKIRHLILAHHGEFEKGSARVPQTLEAVVLHFADNLDAQATGVKQFVQAVKKEDSDWSEFDRINQRYYYLK